jgi:D-glycero-D-manno-heptose 1,7-bisphosphate phosphatase
MGIGEMTKAIFLDRDGVLNLPVVRNGMPHPPAGLDQLEIFPDARMCCAGSKRRAIF